jgi:hypothetical protein
MISDPLAEVRALLARVPAYKCERQRIEAHNLRAALDVAVAEADRRGEEIARLTAERDRLRAVLAADKTTNQPARPAEE